MAEIANGGTLLSGRVREQWDSGGIVDMQVDPGGSISGWSVTADFGGEVVNIWNARVLAVEGTRYVLGPLDYNTAVEAGDSVEFGVEVLGAASFTPLSVEAQAVGSASGTDASGALGSGDVSMAQAEAIPVPDPPAGPLPTPTPPPTPEPAGSDPPLPTPTPSPSPSPAGVPTPPAPPTPEVSPLPLPVPTPSPAPTGQTSPGGAARGPVVAEGGGIGTGGQRLTVESATVSELSTPVLQVRVAGQSVPEPAGGQPDLFGEDFAAGPFSVRGTQILDAAGARAEIHGINWFGLETEIFVPHGLWARNWREIMDDVRSLGFNTLRIPFSGELVASGGGTPSGIDYGLNPDLRGLNGLQILDLVVDYAGTIGMRVLLDYHRGMPGAGPNDNGLWFGEGRTEADVIAEWQVMAERYKDAAAVFGADVVNEPHGGTWGGGSATDWPAAAERIGNAILEIAPDWLIVVEGVATYRGDTYWWGGNLQGVRDRPVVLDIDDRVVYSPHDYPASVHPQPWFSDGSDLVQKFRENWGFIVEDGIAPVMIGEWGSRLQTAADLEWADAIAGYMARLDIPWLWWSLNPNSGDTGGLFEDDWTTVRPAVVDLLDPFLVETRPLVGTDDAAGLPTATVEVRLAMPAEQSLVVKYATEDGTAKAGEDYLARAGTLDFLPGETVKTVSIPVLPDTAFEGSEFFNLTLSGAGGLTGSGTIVIADNEPRAADAVPFVDIAGTVLGDEPGAAQFRIILSEPAPQDVTLEFAAYGEGAAADQVTRGSVVIPAGSRDATVAVSLNGASDGGSQRYVLELTGAEGAALRTARAEGVLEGEQRVAAEVALRDPEGAQTRLTVDLVLEDDWGSGALFNVVLRNVSDEIIEGWQLSLDMPFDLAELWSAVLVADEGERLTLRNREWNGEIAPGSSVDFGFIADDGGISLPDLLARSDLELIIE